MSDRKFQHQHPSNSFDACTPQDPSMWACLAAMAMAAKELSTAEVAFAAIDEVDKLHFVLKVGLPDAVDGTRSAGLRMRLLLRCRSSSSPQKRGAMQSWHSTGAALMRQRRSSYRWVQCISV